VIARGFFHSIALGASCALMASPAAAAEMPDTPPSASQVAVAAMYEDVLVIDLITAIKVAQTGNIDIAEAQQRIRQGRGNLHASIGPCCRRSVWGLARLNSKVRWRLRAEDINWAISAGSVRWQWPVGSSIQGKRFSTSSWPGDS
jgi:hypothetical protein